MTKRLAEASRILGVTLFDHVVSRRTRSTERRALSPEDLIAALEAVEQEEAEAER